MYFILLCSVGRLDVEQSEGRLRADMRGAGVKPNLESEGRLRAGQSSQVRSRDGVKGGSKAIKTKNLLSKLINLRGGRGRGGGNRIISDNIHGIDIFDNQE